MPKTNQNDSGTSRVVELFRAQQQEICRQTDRLFVWLMAGQWLAVLFVALGAPPSVERQLSSFWTTVVAFALGGIFCGIPGWLALKAPGKSTTRFAITIGQMLTSSLFIHLTGGRIEAHFHTFGSLALLALYQDWKVMFGTTVLILADTFARGLFWPASIFGTANSSFWRCAEYSCWILFEDAFLIISIRARLFGMFDMARDKVQLTAINETIERKVAERTSQLKEENAERKRMQAALRKSEEKFRSLSESSPIGIFQADLMGRCIYTNARLQALLGFSFAECLGEGLLKGIHPEDRTRIQEQWAQCIRESKEYATEYRIIDAQGTTRWVYARASSILSDAGEITGYVGTAEDITERKRVEVELRRAHAAAQAAAQAKSEFLANMSHEIRTPMNGVLGMTNLLLDTEMTNQQHEYAKTIQASAEALLTLVNDILDFSKIEAKKLSFEVLDFDLQDTLEGAMELVAESAHAKNLELIDFILPDVPRSLRGDPGRLRQILMNLVSNAIKFTEKGEIVVGVSLIKETDTHTELHFEVKDTGIGIPKEAQQHLFRAFQQADGSTTRKYGGTGLGLVISKQLVEMMNGTIGVKSAPNEGTTFWFDIRFEKQALKESQRRDLSQIKALIVDDNETTLNVLMRQAQFWHVKVECTASGKDALTKLQTAGQTPFNLAVIDTQMPNMDGLALVKSIKAISTIQQPRIVVLVPLGKTLKTDQLRAHGIESCVIKPVKQSRFFQALVGNPQNGQTKLDALDSAGNTDQLDRKLRILMAEDNIINQKVALGQLKKMGYSADVVANGLEAVEAIKRLHYDVILMDCQMPELDGYDATRRIRELERSSGKHVFIIAMTAHAMRGDRDKCIESGMDDYVTKPMREAEFKRALGRCHPHSASGQTRNSSVEKSPLNKNVIDMETLASAANDDPTQLQELIELYLAQARDLMNGLQASIKADSPKQVEHFATKLIGASLACGMSAMVFPLRKLERKGKEGRLEGAQLFYDQADSFLQMTSISLKNYLTGNQNTAAIGHEKNIND